MSQARCSGCWRSAPGCFCRLACSGSSGPLFASHPPRLLGLGDVRARVWRRRGRLLRRRIATGCRCWCRSVRPLAPRCAGSAISSARASSPRSRPAGGGAWPRWWCSRISDSTTGSAGSRRARPCSSSSKGPFDEARRYVEQVSAGAQPSGRPAVPRRRRRCSMRAGRGGGRALRGERDRRPGAPAIRLALGEALMSTAARCRRPSDILKAAFDRSFRIEVAGPLLVRALVLAGRADDAVRATARDTRLGAQGLGSGHGARLRDARTRARRRRSKRFAG